jgi:glutamate dehydrogenase (NAD(P)+)
MGKKFTESATSQLIAAIEKATTKTLSDEEKKLLIRGPDEGDLVNSGLEDTMILAYNEIRGIAKEKSVDLRSAAFISAIDKIAQSYLELGIFP